MKAKHILSNLIEEMNIVLHNKKEEMHCQFKKRGEYCFKVYIVLKRSVHKQCHVHMTEEN